MSNCSYLAFLPFPPFQPLAAGWLLCDPGLLGQPGQGTGHERSVWIYQWYSMILIEINCRCLLSVFFPVLIAPLLPCRYHGRGMSWWKAELWSDERNDSALLQCFPFQLIPISWFTFRSTGGYLRPTTYCWVSLASIGRWNLEPFLLAKTTVSTAWCSVWNSGTHSGQQTDPSSRFRFRLKPRALRRWCNTQGRWVSSDIHIDYADYTEIVVSFKLNTWQWFDWRSSAGATADGLAAGKRRS